MKFRQTLCLIVFQSIFIRCYAVSGVIWSKSQQEFVELYNIPGYANLKAEYISRIQELETHNFRGDDIKAAYHQERNMVLFYNNYTKVTGIFGDMWTLLADYLNFTLVPVPDEAHFFGVYLGNGTFNGLLHEIHTNRIDVIFRSGYYLFRTDILRFTTPFWKTRYRFYIRPEWKYDNTWIITLLSPLTWCSAVFLLITLTVAGYILQRTADEQDKKERMSNLADYTLCEHFFYTFAIMCAQGYVPERFHSRFKILSFSKSVFAWLMLLAYSSHLIYRMTNRTTTTPFNNVDELLNKTKYIILAYKGSMIYDSFSKRVQAAKDDQHHSLQNSRVRFLDNVIDMYIKGCYSIKKYAIFEVEDRFMASTRFLCPLMSTGKSYYGTWISSGIRKDFKYKRALDVAIIKLHEAGLVDALKGRWLEPKIVDTKSNIFKTIDVGQVYLVFVVLVVGIVCSLIVLILEKIAFCFG